MGKLIAFWSPWHGQARVTASMGAVAMAFGGMTKERIVMTHTQFGMADLEGIFDFRMKAEKQRILYESAGLNALMLNFKRAELTREAVERCSIQISPLQEIYLLPGMTQDTGLLQGQELEDILAAVLTRYVAETYEWVFVDLASGKNSFSRRLMDRADVIVVTLSQNMATWKTFFEEYKELAEKENVFYLFGAHKADSKFNMKNFKRLYRRYAKGENTGVVPDCVGYMDAVSEGLAAAFYLMNEAPGKKEENYTFVTECRESAKRIRALAEKDRHKGGSKEE